jgi:hypothetical protein
MYCNIFIGIGIKTWSFFRGQLFCLLLSQSSGNLHSRQSNRQLLYNLQTILEEAREVWGEQKKIESQKLREYAMRVGTHWFYNKCHWSCWQENFQHNIVIVMEWESILKYVKKWKGKLGMIIHICNSYTWEVEEDHKFGTILVYIASSRPPWATEWDPASLAPLCKKSEKIWESKMGILRNSFKTFGWEEDICIVAIILSVLLV